MKKSFTKKTFLEGATALAFLAAVSVGAVHASDTSNPNATLDKQVIAKVRECQRMSVSCASETQNAVGVLVFPSVIKADLVIGGSGGRGALIENSRITGYYSLGSGSVGLQAGVDKTSQIYVFRTPQALADLKNSPDWQGGTSAGVTLVSAANSSNTSNVTGDVLAYIFNSRGLHGGVALDVFDIWKTGDKRPPSSQTSEAQ